MRADVLDIFRVLGGTQHEYTLHGSRTIDMTSQLDSTSNVALTALSGSHPLLPDAHSWGDGPPWDTRGSGRDARWYGMYAKDVRKGTLAGTKHCRVKFEGICDGTEFPLCEGRPAPGVSIWAAGRNDGTPEELILAVSADVPLCTTVAY